MRFYLLSLLVLLLTGCSTTTLHYQDKLISLQNPHYQISLTGETLYTDQRNLGTIFIEQRVFSSELDGLLVYEYARLQTGYKFKFNYQYILRHIFQARSVKEHANKEGLGFYTIVLEDGSHLNAILKTGTKKSLTMVYGLSDKNFNALMEGKPLGKADKNERNAQEQIKSRWNMKLIIGAVLLEEVGGRAAYR